MNSENVLISASEMIEDMERISCIADDTTYVRMSDLIEEKKFTAAEILQLLEGVIKILLIVEKSSKILGSIKLSNIFIDKNDYFKVYYLTDNRLLDIYDGLTDYETGDIVAPEISNKYFEYIDSSTDVYLIGKILIKLVNNNRILDEGYHKEQIISYNYEALNIDLPIEIHHFIYSTSCINKEKRYESVSKCDDMFNKIKERDFLRRNISTDINISKIECSIKTNVGIGKLAKAKEIGKSLVQANEDSSIISSFGDNKKFFMVADGISNCEYGSGYEASNIVKKVSKELWKKYGGTINSKEDAEAFINKIIRISNGLILKSVSTKLEAASISDINEGKGVMGTTFTGGIIIDNKLMYFNVGDSRIYLFTDERYSSLLTVDDNKGLDEIFNGLSWDKYKKLDGKSHLTKFVGGIRIKDDEILPNNMTASVKEVGLLPGDILVACSDGLTDMLKENIIGDSIWDPDEIIGQILLENSELEIYQKNDILINLANENGGKDNITSILIKCY